MLLESLTYVYAYVYRYRRSSIRGLFDGFWQRRGNGRSYNSKSGGGTTLGGETKKVLAWGVRITDCAMCSYHRLNGTTAPLHACQKDWDGSAKAMEADLDASLIKELEQKGVHVNMCISYTKKIPPFFFLK